MPIILAVWEAEITVQGQPEQTVHETHLPFGLVRPKWTGGMAQAVQRLLFKCEALSSNPSSAPPPKIFLVYGVKYIFQIFILLWIYF
jgi:hypothetical protein